MTTKPLYEASHLRTVRLYGKLGARFGRVHRMAVASTAEAVRALCVLYDGFEAYLLASKDQGVGFAVFLGKHNIDENQLTFQTSKDIRIAPVIVGSKSGGLVSIILGAALIAVSFFIPGGGLLAAGLFNAGMAMALGGIVQLLSPQPKDPKSKDDPEKEPNYAFNGPINTEAQGHCVPVAYGWPWTGSAVISAGIQADADVIIPVTSGLVATNNLLARNPEFYYPLKDGGTTLVDISGHGHDDLTLSGGGVSGGSGVIFDDTGTGDARAPTWGDGFIPSEDWSVFIKVNYIDLAVGGADLFRTSTNAVFGWYNWAVFKLPDGLGGWSFNGGANHQAGSGNHVGTSDAITEGQDYVVGIQRRNDIIELIVNDSIVSSTPATGAYGSSANLELGQTIGDGTPEMQISDFIGFRYAFGPAELPGLKEDMLNPVTYAPVVDSDNGDDAWGNTEEELTDG